MHHQSRSKSSAGIFCVVSWCCGLLLVSPPAPALDPLTALRTDKISRLEWGIERLHRALLQHFSVDPLSLEPSQPAFFVNVSYVVENDRILIEIGRTFAQLARATPKDLCAEYIARVRGFLSVNPLGKPAINNASSIAAEYFHPIDSATAPTSEFAEALDQRVVLRGLVATPLNGDYAICGARLTGESVRYVE